MTQRRRDMAIEANTETPRTRRAVLLDSDGTVIVERRYLGSPGEVVLEQDAAAGLRMLMELDYALVIVSNQSGIARGLLTQAQVLSVNRRLETLLESEAVHVLGWYVFPHGPDDRCGCRKPQAGLAKQASREHRLDLSASIVIGDKRSDIEMASAIGTIGILVTTGHGEYDTEWARSGGYVVCRNLLEAAEIIRRRETLYPAASK